MKNFLLGVMSTVLLTVLLGANLAHPDYEYKFKTHRQDVVLSKGVVSDGRLGYEIVAVEDRFIYMQKASRK